MSLHSTSQPPPALNIRWWRISQVACYAALACGLLSLFGWLSGTEWPTRLGPTLPSMKFNTALSISCLSLALLLAPRWIWAARALAVFVAVIGTLTIFEHLTGRDLGICELVVRDPIQAGAIAPGRPGLATAVCFVLLSLALLTTSCRRPLVAPILQILTIWIGVATLAGYVIMLIWPDIGAMFTHMAVHTALAFTLLAWAGLIRTPANRVAELMSGTGPHPLRWKLIAPFLLIGVPLLCGSLWIVVAAMLHITETQALESARGMLTAIRALADAEPDNLRIQRAVHELAENPRIESIVIVRGQPLTVVASTDTKWVGLPLSALPLKHVGEDLSRALKNGVDHYDLHHGRGLLIDCTGVIEGEPGGPPQGAIMVHYDAAPLRASLFHAGQVVLLVTLAIFAVGFTVTWRTVHHVLLAPLAELNTVVARREAGDSLCRVPRPADDEIGRVGAALNSLFAAADTAQAENSRLALVSRLTRNSVVICDAKRRIVWVNEAFIDMTGYTFAEALG